MAYILIIIIIAFVSVDQILKMIVVNTLEIGQSIQLIEGVFHFTYVRNFGSAFSMLQGKQTFLLVFTCIGMIVIAVILIKNIKSFSRIMNISLSLVLAGGIGNAIDRFRMGYVVDFLDFRLIHFPIFNFADCCVVIGAIGMIFAMFLSERNNSNKKDG